MRVKHLIFGISLAAIFFASIIVLTQEKSYISTPNYAKQEINENLTKYVKEYSLPENTWPNGILVDRYGFVWVAGSKIHDIFKFSPNQESFVTSFNIEDGFSDDESTNSSLMSWSMVEDHDGMIWFSQMGQNPIWMFNPNSEKFRTFDAKASPFQMKVDEKGNIWFTTLTADTIGVIQKNNDGEKKYTISEFDLNSDSLPSGIFLEKDHIWITLISKNKLAKYKPVTDDDGIITNIIKVLEIPVVENLIYSPTDMTIINDSIWIAEHGTSFVTKLDNNQRSITRFPTSQNQYEATTLPFWIRNDASGNSFWFNEHTGNKIGYFNTEKLELIEYEIPSRPHDGYLVLPLNIATDPTNSNLLWFSEWNTHKIALIDKSISFPFDIAYEKNRKLFVKDNDSHTRKISLDVIKNKDVLMDGGIHNIITLNASSSIELNGGLGDVTVEFSTNQLNLMEMSGKEKVDVTIRNIPDTGSHTLGISATNGLITKSIFFELISN